MYSIFLGAPSASALNEDPRNYEWKTISLPGSLPPPATLDAATRRISLYYQNIIFREDGEEQELQLYEGQDTIWLQNDTYSVFNSPRIPGCKSNYGYNLASNQHK